MKVPGSLACLVILGVILQASLSHAQAVSFSPATNFAVGTNPIAIAVGDLNGDGKLDLAVANQCSHDVSILLGTGTGSFEEAPTVALEGGCDLFSVAIGDLNGDGILDLVVPNGNVLTLLGTGTGTFGTAMNVPVGGIPVAVAIGDFNGDGIPDLAVADQLSQLVTIHLGTGDGSYLDVGELHAVGSPTAIAIGDFNGDGKLDLAVPVQGGAVVILLGDGTGSFGSFTDFFLADDPGSPGVPSNPGFSVGIADLNGDGKLDLAVMSQNTNIVSVLLGTGTGSFSAATGFPVGGTPVAFGAIAIGDLNGDGKLDLAVTDGESNVSILLGTGTGSFEPFTSVSAGTSPSAVAIGDFNQDGKPDLAVANYDSNNVSILLNMTALTPAEATSNLITTVNSLDLPTGVQTSLAGPLNQVVDILNDNNPNNDAAACGKLGAFMNQVNAKEKSGALTSGESDGLRQSAEAIGASLGCP